MEAIVGVRRSVIPAIVQVRLTDPRGRTLGQVLLRGLQAGDRQVLPGGDLGLLCAGRRLREHGDNTLFRPVQTVSYPVLAKLQDDRVRLKTGYRAILRLGLFIVFPSARIAGRPGRAGHRCAARLEVAPQRTLPPVALRGGSHGGSFPSKPQHAAGVDDFI